MDSKATLSMSITEILEKSIEIKSKGILRSKELIFPLYHYIISLYISLYVSQTLTNRDFRFMKRTHTCSVLKRAKFPKRRALVRRGKNDGGGGGKFPGTPE